MTIKQRLVQYARRVVAAIQPSIDQNLTGLQTLAVAAMLERQRNPFEARFENASKHYQPASPKPFDQCLAKLEQLEPSAFPIWVRLFEDGSKAYRENPIYSCSVWGNRYAEAFRDFCAIHLSGRVLDIGCGPIGKPIYVKGWPSSHFSAVEPLEMMNAVDFEVVRGFAESLPWPDASFDTVIVATSLDHVLSLTRAMEEIRRVMTDKGKLLLWIGIVGGAEKYDPRNPKAIDAFHMFHFDDLWLDPLLEEFFEIQEKLMFMIEAGGNAFYVVVKKPQL